MSTFYPLLADPIAPCESCGARVPTVSVHLDADISSTGHAYWIRLCPACYQVPDPNGELSS